MIYRVRFVSPSGRVGCEVIERPSEADSLRFMLEALGFRVKCETVDQTEEN